MSGWRILQYIEREERGQPQPTAPLSYAMLSPDRPFSGRLVVPGVTPPHHPGLTFAEAEGRTDVAWVPPAQSTASRKITPVSMASVRGHVVDPGTNRVLMFESMLEYRFANILMAQRTIISIEDQPPMVRYVNSKGRMTHHTFDFRATFRNGSRVAYAVKPAARLKKDNVLDVVNRIRAVHVPEFANEVLVVTEAQATPVLGLNAIDIVHARKTRIQTDCEEVLQLAHGLGPIEVWRLCQCAFDPGCVKNALLCLIYDGRLRLLNPRERFGDASVVQTNAVM